MSVCLRTCTAKDADAFASWSQDAQFCSHAGWTPGLTFEEYRSFHRDLIEQPPADLLRLTALENERVIGFVDLHGVEAHRRELGYTIGPRSEWGRGRGLAAAKAGLDYGFNQLGLMEIWAEALDANRASVKILQRLEMRETGRGDDAEYLGQPTYYRQFSIGASEWCNGRVSIGASE